MIKIATRNPSQGPLGGSDPQAASITVPGVMTQTMKAWPARRRPCRDSADSAAAAGLDDSAASPGTVTVTALRGGDGRQAASEP